MSFSRVRRDSVRSVEVFEDVRCDRCDALLAPGVPSEDGGFGEHLQGDRVLHLRLGGGYGEFVDVFDEREADDLHVLLCEGCAKAVVDLLPFLRPRVFNHLNLNVGHTCTDGSQVWVPMPECALDPDRHGWRTVFVVAPAEQPRGRGLVGFGIFSTRPEAEVFAAAQSGPVVVQPSPVANVSVYRAPDGSPLLVPPAPVAA